MAKTNAFLQHGIGIPARSRRAVVLATLLFGSICSYLVISHLVIDLVEVSGDSMMPGLHSGDVYLLHRYPYLFRNPGPGEVVAIRDPQDENLSVKRIVAVPGDRLAIVDGLVSVNGVALSEQYVNETGVTYTVTGEAFQITLTTDQYFVLGDNRRNSIDARVYGPVARRSILGVIRSP